MKKAAYTFSVLIALLVSIGSCTHKDNSVAPVTGGSAGTGGNGTGGTGGTGGGGNTGGSTNPSDTALCFRRDILPIFQSNCAKSGCHDAASAQDGFVFTSYQTITSRKFEPGDPWDTELFEKITETDPGEIMPPPPNAPLTQDQIGKIYRWIAMGAPNTTNCGSGCDTSDVTFSAKIKPMLDLTCKGCHNSTSASAGVNLDNYAGVNAVATNGKLLSVIKQLPGYPAMPKGGTKLSDCQIRQVELWISAGAQNN
jgi:hypothetical protein